MSVEGRVVRCLSFHSQYRCRNTGVCCSSGWEIAVETDVEARLTAALLLNPSNLPNGPDGFQPMSDPPSGCRSSLRRRGSACWFRDDRGRACAIHREYGEESLPSACRQFPRICVLEPDGVSVSLSHYCPTAAGMLFGSDPKFSVVTHPAAFPDAWPFEGLDARNSYPPFLRAGVSLGFDGLRAVEDGAVGILSNRPLWDALSAIDAAVEDIRAWTVASGPLPDLVRHSFARTNLPSSAGSGRFDPRPALQSAVPDGTIVDVELPAFEPGPMTFSPDADLVLRKYLAARLIAAWIMFQSTDLSSVVKYLRLCLNAVLLFETAAQDEPPGPSRLKQAIRYSDLWLLHYCDPERLARNLS